MSHLSNVASHFARQAWVARMRFNPLTISAGIASTPLLTLPTVQPDDRGSTHTNVWFMLLFWFFYRRFFFSFYPLRLAPINGWGWGCVGRALSITLGLCLGAHHRAHPCDANLPRYWQRDDEQSNRQWEYVNLY